MGEEEERLSVSQGMYLCELRDAAALPRSYMAVSIASFVILAGATMPTPLYQTYREAFGFSDFMLTVVFGVYVLGVVPALLIFGPVGDIVCRRRVLLVAICVEAVGIVCLALAWSVVWLLVGRTLVGIAVGASQGNLSAALVEMQPRHDRRRAGMMTTVSSIGGAAAGPLIGGLLGGYEAGPTPLCYVVEMGFLALALALVVRIPEAGSQGPLTVIEIHHPGVPKGIGARFVSAGISGGLSWAIGGFFVALAPTYVSGLLHTRSLAAGGALVALMLGSNVAGQLAMNGLSPYRLQVFGLTGGVVGLGALIAAWTNSSMGLMLMGSVVCGAFTGMAFLGSVSELNRLVRPEERGSVNSLYFVVVYLFFTIPTVALGLGSGLLGLYPALRIFSAIIALLTMGEVLWLIILQRTVPEPE